MQQEIYDYSEEQVYNKNIDDLMDYIMQPQDGKGGKNRKKKQKQRKGACNGADEQTQ